MSLTVIILCAVIGLTSGVGVLPEDSVVAAVGGSVTFTTSLTTTETTLHYIVWNAGPQLILTSVAGTTIVEKPYEGRIILSSSTGSLELRNLALGDSGEYAVIIRPTAGGGSITGRTTLKVEEPVSNVTITVNSSTDLVEFNDTVTLSCSASGSSPTFLWFKDSVEVRDDDRVQITDGGATLSIVTVWRVDQGLYTCNASNSVSSNISDEQPLCVSYGPEDVILTIFPVAELYGEGSVVSLSCSADSRPVSHFFFQWVINEEMLTSPGAKINLVLEQSGNYSCQAFNSKTLRYNTSQPAEITVLKKTENGTVTTSNPPVEGGSVNLTCDASGSSLTREWTLNGTELKSSGNIVFYEEKQVLSFRVLNRSDNGIYTCIISNPVSNQSVNYTMKVNYGPDIVWASGPETIEEGATLKLSCSAQSVPTAKFSWTKDGMALIQSHEYIKENIGLSDGGEYTCRATNDITDGFLEAFHTVNVTEKIHTGNHCSTGCIVGIVFGCIAVILLVSGGVFFELKRKKQKQKANTRTDGEGRDNSAYSQNQDVTYADVKFVKKDGAVVQLGAQSNNPPASRLPTYDAHMQRGRKPAPEPPTEYAQVRPR